jgi:hypothetical protein
VGGNRERQSANGKRQFGVKDDIYSFLTAIIKEVGLY